MLALAGCSDRIAAQTQITPPPAPAQSSRDYATELALAVESRQPSDTPNRWSNYSTAVIQIAGAWEYFTLSDPAFRRFRERSPEDRSIFTDPQKIGSTPAHADLGQAVRGFFDNLEQSNVMDELDRIAGASHVAPRNVDLFVETQMPELGATRLHGRLCAARMRFAALDGKPELALRWLDHGLSTASAAQGRGVLMAYFAADAAWSELQAEIRRELIADLLTAEICQTMLHMFEERSSPDLQAAIEGERFATLEIIDRYFEKTREEAGRDDEVGERARMSLLGTTPQDEQVRHAEAFYAIAAKLFDRSVPEVDVRQQLAQFRGQMNAAGGRSNLPVANAVPNVTAAMDVWRKLRVHHAGTKTMLALQVFRGRHGRYPATLDELVPEVLPELPTDPFAAGPLRYRVHASSDSDQIPRTGYLLYSVGADGVDHKGVEKPDARGQSLIWSAKPGEFDYVINSTVP